jgi:hypothetical protein
MQPVIMAVHDYALDYANTFRRNRKLKLRIACVCYRDPIDSPNDRHQVHPFNNSVHALMQFLKGIEASGGGDAPEDYAGAIQEVLKLEWRTTARRGIIWIAGAPAHGRRFCGVTNHQEEEPKLEPLVRQLTLSKVTFQGVALNRQTQRTFIEMEKIYQEANPAAVFKAARFKKGEKKSDANVTALGQFVTETLSTSLHDFLWDIPSRPAPSTEWVPGLSGASHKSDRQGSRAAPGP